MKKIATILIVSVAMLVQHSANAQEIDTVFQKKNMDYLSYIGTVGKQNAAYAAERFNLSMAEAEIQTAKIFPDPELSFSGADNGQRRMNMGYGFGSELSWTLELGGKRKARIDLAKNEMQLATLLLEDYFRNLRADATIAFLTGLQNHMLLQVQYDSYQQVKQLAASDSIRHKLGAISLVDARQSKLEAGIMLNEVYSAEAELKTSLAALSLWLGSPQEEALLNPTGSFSGFDRTFNLQELITTALNNRADVKAALQNKQLSQSIMKLAKADRAMDIELSLGLDYNSYVRNHIAPTPSFTTVNAGISIPLKFSNNRSADVRVAQYGVLQAHQEFRQTELEIQTEIVQSYQQYQAVQKQVRQFDKGLLTESKAILDGKIYSYQRGETSLLEVLDAQRTYNEIQQGYYQTLYSYAEALVELERAAGIWDINF